LLHVFHKTRWPQLSPLHRSINSQPRIVYIHQVERQTHGTRQLQLAAPA